MSPAGLLGTGNAAVRRMVEGVAAAGPPAAARDLLGAAGLARNAAIRRLVEPGAAVSHPADPAERQADAVALELAGGRGAATGGLARTAGAGPPVVPGSAGVPLPRGLRGPAEAELGADLSGVRIHDDTSAHAFARDVGAQAATVGPHVYFGAGRFAPESPVGQRLLRHELVHTLQPAAAETVHRSPESDARLAEIDRRLATYVISDEYRTQLERERATLAGGRGAAGARGDPAAALQQRVTAFKSLVTATAVQRLGANRQSLSQWSQVIQTTIPAADLATVGLLQTGGMQPFLDAQNMSDPGMRELRLRQAVGQYRACTGCHVEVSLYNTREERMSAGGAHVGSPDWVAPNAQRAQGPGAFRPRPGTLEARFNALIPDPADAAARAERLRAVLRTLGSQGYDVLPAAMAAELETSSVEALRSRIGALIEERQSGYTTLSARIAAGELGYEHFGPIIRELLPRAEAEVRTAIEQEMAEANRWRLAEAIVVGILSIAALVATLFPPTSALGLVALGGLEVGLGVYGGVRGAEAISVGTAYQQGTGAHDVFSPAQQDAGGGMAAMGFINVVLAPLAVVAGAIRAGTGLSRVGASATALLPPGQPYVRGGYIVTYAEDGAIVATLRDNPEIIIILRGNTLTVYQSMGDAGLRVISTMDSTAAWRAAGLPALPPGAAGAEAVGAADLALPGGQAPPLLGPYTPAPTTPGRFQVPLGPEGSGGFMFSDRPPPVNVLPTTGPPGGAPPAYSLPMGPQGAGGVMLMGRGLRPSDFGLAYIADDAELLGMWNQALRESAAPGMNNAYTRYLAAIEDGTVASWSSSELSQAFGAVNTRFMAAARGAGYDVATVHHWNYPKSMYWQQIVDPRQLVPLPGQAQLRGGYLPLHQGGLHPLTTGVPGNPTGGPVAPVHAVDLPVWMSTIR